MNSPVICSLEQRRVTRQRTFTVTDIVTRLSVMPASVSKIYNSDIAEYLFLLLSFCRITVIYGFIHAFKIYRVSQKSDPLNILQQQPQICSDFNKNLLTQDDICCKHYYIVSYKSALTLLKYEFL